MAAARIVACVAWIALGVVSAQESRPVAPESRATESKRAAVVRRTSGTPVRLCELSRGPCLGGCPTYTVEVLDDGTVVYVGSRSVKVAGRKTSQLSDTRFDELVRAFETARFFDLLPEYTHRDYTDYATVTVAFAWGGRSATVRHYNGDVLAPRSLRQLEETIDRIAGTAELSGPPSGPAATTRMASRPKLGTVQSYDSAAGAVTLALDAGEEMRADAVVILSSTTAYRGRVRVMSVDGTKVVARLEHLEPGQVPEAGDLVWGSR